MNIMRAYQQRSEFPQALEEAKQVAQATARVMAFLAKRPAFPSTTSLEAAWCSIGCL